MSHIPLLMHLVSIEYPVSLMKKETKEQIWVKLIIYTVFHNLHIFSQSYSIRFEMQNKTALVLHITLVKSSVI